MVAPLVPRSRSGLISCLLETDALPMTRLVTLYGNQLYDAQLMVIPLADTMQVRTQLYYILIYEVLFRNVKNYVVS